MEQKLDIAIKISKLKETEETCSCTGWCAINHQKHSWKRYCSKEIHSKVRKLAINLLADKRFMCSICEKIFTNEGQLETHMQMHENVNLLSKGINSFVHE